MIAEGRCLSKPIGGEQAHPIKHFVFTGQAPGVAEDPKGLKPTDRDCWWEGEQVRVRWNWASLAMWGFQLALAGSKSVDEPERLP